MSKASLRSIAATISDIHSFFTNDQVLATGVDLKADVAALSVRVAEIAADFDKNMKGVPEMGAKRLEWDSSNARALENDLRNFLPKIKAAADNHKLSKVVAGYGPHKLTIGILISDTTNILNADGSRNAGPYRGAPFTGIPTAVQAATPN